MHHQTATLRTINNFGSLSRLCLVCRPMKALLRALVLLLYAVQAHAAGQTVIPNYDTARRDFFWTQLYSNGGRDLYCNVRFIAGQRLTVEHAFAADWIATHHGCPNRNECPIPAYGFAEADLHNLWPAIGAINSSRGDKLFSEIPGNKPTLPSSVADLKCDYERTTGPNAVVEPRNAVKGEIARSLFYMHVEYGLGLKG